MAAEITCPNCKSHIAITLGPVETPAAPRRPRSDITPLTNKALGDVFAFMQKAGEGTYWSTELYQSYLANTELAKPLSQKAFSAGLQRNGAERWRTSRGRGYTIPDMTDRQPATMSPQQRERFEAAHQREAVQAHIGGDNGFAVRQHVVTDLPFEVDGLDPA